MLLVQGKKNRIFAGLINLKYKEIIKSIQNLNKLLLQNYANGNKECILVSTSVYRKIYSLPIMRYLWFTTKMNQGYLCFGELIIRHLVKK
ncbi:MAG: hypothetical protein AN485_21155 [Anabaena sp. MDT14b]|nr:MAG: hypothetical protein AN485_21155 [Anabaena sp. MDT14b]